ncbi:MAG: isopeptide-forming domain-containing fimbrial protein [Pyrinomonadaceae bacterium]
MTARARRAGSFPCRLCAALTCALFAALLCASRAGAQVCANSGEDGVASSLSGVVNTYFPGAASASAGATSITLGTMRAGGSATAIASGDLLLVIQMQDGTFNSTNGATYGNGTGRGASAVGNAGLYEYVVATSASAGGGAVSIRGANGGGLVNAYTNAAANTTAGAGAQGQRRFQVIRVPQYSSATLVGTLTAPAWDGSSGGVVVLDIAGNLNLNGGTISVAGLGFRGGGGRPLVGGKAITGGGNPSPTNTDYAYLSSSPETATNGAHGSKGEGILGRPRYVFNPATNTVDELSPTAEGYPNGSYARGAPGNAGGGGTDSDGSGVNQNNSGGGGGAGGGDGGHGGNTWSDNATVGGLGGVALPNSATRVVQGGGGGAGSRNNSVSYDSSGASGGGIVLIRVNTVSGAGTINADGNAAWNNTANDGGGGGGAGGSVVVSAAGSLSGLNINARGGRGGDAWRTGGTSLADRHGPGGGGGGGFVAQTGGASASVAGGAHGVTTTLLDAYNSTDGATGQTLVITQTQIPGADSGAECIPTLTTTKTTTTASVNNSSAGATATYKITVTAAANRSTATGISFSDALPTGFTYASTGTITLAGSASRPSTANPAAGATNPAWSSFTIPAGGQVQLTFTVAIASTVARGTYQNSATATYLDPRRTVTNGTTSSNYDPASSTGEDVLVLSPPTLDMQKRCTSPANCESAPQQPNTDLTYTITFTNTGDQIARNITITDIVPFSLNVPASSIIRSTEFKVGSLSLAPGTSGLTLAAVGKKYYSDAVVYPGNPPWTPATAYTPVGTYDPNVTYVAWQLTGTLAPGASASVSFIVRIK